MRTVIFDLDGTLADTSRDLINAANVCFRELGLGDVLDPMTDGWVGMQGGKAMLREGFRRTASHGDAEIERQYPRLLEAYSEALDHYSVLFPGVEIAVEALARQGYRVGICTNKPEALAERLMVSLGVRDMFGALVGADTLPVRKPDPAPLRETIRRVGGDPARAVLVGDTATDRDTARAAGVASILVTFGPLGAAVRDLMPNALLEDYSELPEVVSGLIG